VALKFVIRGTVIWAIEVVALGLLTVVLPGVSVTDRLIGVVAALVIALLNALVRPIVLLFAQNLGLVIFGLISLVLNGLVVLLATRVLPGFVVDTLWSAFLLAFGLAVLNTLASSLLGINDDDSFYRNVIRWLERRRVPLSDLTVPGTVLVQIDGLSESILRSEIEAGQLPTLARWLASGSHRLTGWECDVPSMTTSGQAGILYGNNANIPAFRWYDKSSGHLLVSNHPRDARLIDQRQATEHGLLREHGSSVGNIVAGGAEHCVVTMSRLESESGRIAATPRDVYDYFVNPYNLYRAVGAMLWEMAIEVWQAWLQRRRNVQPRISRGGNFPLMRAATAVLLRDVTTWTLIADMFAGRRVSYADYLGYDEVAHHAGPDTEDARGVLRKMEGQFRRLESAARRAPRRYRFVVLSDHGQSTGATFRQRYGLTLEELVRQLMASGDDVQIAGGNGEGWGQVNALRTEVVRIGGVVGRGIGRLFGQTDPFEPVDIDPASQARARIEKAEVVVCASGNLGLVYFARRSGRLTHEAIAATYPGLVEGLVNHPGVGFVLVLSEVTGGPVVLGDSGSRDLDSGKVSGVDPLAAFGIHTGAFLRRLSSFPNVGDIVINSVFEPGTGHVAAFEELIGCHGGAGGQQTAPFIVYPAEWRAPPTLVGAEQVHAFLNQYLSPRPHAERSDWNGQPVDSARRASTGKWSDPASGPTQAASA
jgi:uncharacterized membrane protein YvlD (DUF360 family)